MLLSKFSFVSQSRIRSALSHWPSIKSSPDRPWAKRWKTDWSKRVVWFATFSRIDSLSCIDWSIKKIGTFKKVLEPEIKFFELSLSIRLETTFSAFATGVEQSFCEKMNWVWQRIRIIRPVSRVNLRNILQNFLVCFEFIV